MDGLEDRALAVLEYWFGKGFQNAPLDGMPPADRLKIWFEGGTEVDKEILDLFGTDVEHLSLGLYDTWIEHPYNGLAAVLLMDQFTRNIYRGKPQAFFLDFKARTWANHLLTTGRAAVLTRIQRCFLFLPFEHSEELEDQERCVKLYVSEVESVGPDSLCGPYLRMALHYAVQHRDVIAKWGRFPHRNAILGRQSTPEEEDGLQDGSIKKF